MAANPYGYAHQQLRRALLVPGAVCHMCGAPAAELDHQPPLVTHRHVAGSGCCRVLPACSPCQRAQGGALGFPLPAPVLPAPTIVEADASPGPDHAMWDVPWLQALLPVPDGATWPRYMTAPHPNATGSHGPVAVAWLEQYAGLELRWWQRLVLYRQLEHDAQRRLVWLEALVTTARQVGKSTALRGGAHWRLHAAKLFGEPQMILHTGKDLPVCKEVQRPARIWAKELGYYVREQNGNEEIEAPDHSRWIVRGKGSIYGYSAGYGIVDEAWGVDAQVVDDGLAPTMAERTSPQMVLASTAHRSATSLFPTRRTVALDELAAPSSTLLLEWSASRETRIDDRQAWRQASPHWGETRERLLEGMLTRVQAGAALDPDESDPVESFRAQYLNVWPVRTSNDPGNLLIDPLAWGLCARATDSDGAPIVVAVEDNYGRGAAVAVAAPLAGSDAYELGGWLVPSWADAMADAVALGASRESTLLVGASLAQDCDPRQRPTVCGAAETRTGLALLRQLVAAGRVVHDQAPDLEQLTAVRVRELPSGLAIVAGHRADLTRAAAWALQVAHARPPAPAIW